MNKFATPEATQAYQSRFPCHPDKRRFFDGLSLSAMAVGTYLGPSDLEGDALYEDSLVQAGQNGINFFDTAINYRCQRSERNIAYALRKLAGLGIPRDQLFISTKGGFLPADSDPQTYQETILKCYLNTGILAPEDIVENCHCMTPKYLQTQIDLSIKNLKIDSIDLYYLHNPETQLRSVSQNDFYKNLQKVFELFEKNIADEKIKRYGLATWNGFRQGFGAPDLLDLEKILKVAKEVAGDKHHFCAIQLPYNLAMLEAVGIPNQKIGGEDFPILPAAAHHGVAVMISAPLMQTGVLKLPQGFYGQIPGEESSVQKALQFVLSSPGVTSVMVGMKTKKHVDENRHVLQIPNWTVENLQDISRSLIRN